MRAGRITAGAGMWDLHMEALVCRSHTRSTAGGGGVLVPARLEDKVCENWKSLIGRTRKIERYELKNKSGRSQSERWGVRSCREVSR